MEDSTAELKRLAKETQDIRNSMLSLMFAWANLENALAVLFGALIRDSLNNLASAIYFAPANTETRMSIVTAALKVTLAGSPHFDEIQERWKSIQNRFVRKKKIRNQIAHGQIITTFIAGANHVRLTSPMLDFSRLVEALSKGQKPGLGASEINNAAMGIDELTKTIYIWSAIVDAIHRGDDETLLQKLSLLAPTPPRDRNSQ